MKDSVVNTDPATTQTRVLNMFRSGFRPADLAREIGKAKKQVGRILAEAIKEVGNGCRN